MSFSHPPVSLEMLNKFISLVINRTFTNSHVTLAYFRGAGKPFELRYLLSNYSEVPMAQPNRVYIWLDLKVFANSPSTALKDSLTFLLTHFEETLNQDIKEKLSFLVSSENLVFSDYATFIHTHLIKGAHMLTFVFEHFDLSYSPVGNMDLVNTVNSLRKMNLNKVSCLFLVGAEFTESHLEILADLKEHFLANVVWGNNLPFDSFCITQAFDNFSSLYNKTFSTEFKDVVSRLAYGDPTLMRRIAMLAINDEGFERNFVLHCDDLNYVVDLIEPVWFEKRYTELLLSLSEESVMHLRNAEFHKLSEYVKKCGVLNSVSTNELQVVNPLFDYFIVNTLPLLFKDKRLLSHKLVLSPEHYLSAQELLLLEFLEKNATSVITRESIAKVIWGDIWEEKFSDWALDKLISTLRKKLTSNSYPKTILTLKGRGVILS